MGYESRLYVVSREMKFCDGVPRYAEVIAEINLCKVYIPLDRFFAKEADCYIYIDHEITTKDCYGKPLTICTDLKGFIAWMKEQNKAWYYRRWGMAIALLKSIKPTEWNDIQVLHYGY